MDYSRSVVNVNRFSKGGSMSKPQKTVEEIIKGAIELDVKENTDCYVDPTCSVIIDLPKVKADLYQLILSLVGEDEPEPLLMGGTRQQNKANLGLNNLVSQRNQVRAELRKKLSEHFNGEERDVNN